MKKLFYILIGIMGLSTMLTTTVSCIDNDPTKESYYTFTGEMVTDYLENRNEDFSEFIEVLKRAELWDLLSTYGEFTCFAPTNSAMDTYLKAHGYGTVDNMPDAECDTLAWMHILKAAYFTTEFGEGSLPSTNLNGRYLTLSCDAEGDDNDDLAAVWRVNGSELIARDDSVENGVMHVVNRVISASSILIGEKVIADPNLKIFGQALQLTGLADSLVTWIDESYHPDVAHTAVNTKDASHKRIFGGNDTWWRYPATREFKYTIFAETDSILEHKSKGRIKTIDDLIAYAKEVYDVTYPDDKDKYDDDYTNRRNPLNRFVAYHILDRQTTYSEITISELFSIKSYFQTSVQDIQEFYETLCPYTIMKVCDASGQKYINRKGVGANAEVRGCRIFTPTESKKLNPNYEDAPNGTYFYIDDIMLYDKEKTINQALNTRMRMDATTLSPDFMNAGARNSNPSSEAAGISFFMTRFMPGYAKNFYFSDKTFFGVHCRVGYFNSWEGDNCACLDNFNIKFKLPPVPADQTYEIRLGYTVGEKRTVVQVYFDDNGTGDMPCGIPVDLRKYAGEYGWQSDEELENNEELIEANDKALRNNGYMKAYDSYWFSGATNPRSQVQCLRRILTTKYLAPERDYYIRLRQVLDNNAEMSLDYIELVPKSVYDGMEAEDKH